MARNAVGENSKPMCPRPGTCTTTSFEENTRGMTMLPAVNANQ